MNNSNPFVPQGSLLEQKSRKQKRVKYAVYSILAANVLVIMPLLIQGCKKEPEPDTSLVDSNTNTAPDLSTNAPVLTEATNQAPAGTNQPNMQPPPAQVVQTPVPPPAQETPNPSEYVVAKGDSYYTIAKKYNVKMKELEAANPTVPATRMKVGQKLQIPAGGSASVGAPGASVSGVGMEAPEGNVTETYTVKAGDSLTKISKHFGVSIKAIRYANKMSNDHILVGKKLKIPAKAAPAAPSEAAAPAPIPQPAPAPTAPATSPAPVGAQQQ
jgi:membrane-bound lytic murein transglycosylase D